MGTGQHRALRRALNGGGDPSAVPTLGTATAPGWGTQGGGTEGGTGGDRGIQFPPVRLAGLEFIHALQDCCPPPAEEEEEGRTSAPCMLGDVQQGLAHQPNPMKGRKSCAGTWAHALVCKAGCMCA